MRRWKPGLRPLYFWTDRQRALARAKKADAITAGKRATDCYSAGWFDDPHRSHGGTYGVRGPLGLVHATGPFKKDWEKAQTMAAEMNATAGADVNHAE